MLHVTPALLESPMTVAMNCCFPPDGTEAVAGASVTSTEGTVIVAEADSFGSLIKVAVSVTIRLVAGGVGGAAYVVLVPEVGETAPHEAAEQVIVQFTFGLRFGFPNSIATNSIVAPACTVPPELPRPIPCAGGRAPLPHPIWLAARTRESSIPESDMRFFDLMANLPYLLCEPLGTQRGELAPYLNVSTHRQSFSDPRTTSSLER
jgi:hypothetical protein